MVCAADNLAPGGLTESPAGSFLKGGPERQARRNVPGLSKRAFGPAMGHIGYPMSFSALAGLVFGVAVITIGLYHSTMVGPRLRSISRTLRGDGASSSEAESVALLRASLLAYGKKTDERLDELETILKRDLHRVGFIRYNSFDDVGSDLSFTLALLNDDGDGVVVTSIYSREETRTYGKAVRKFVPQQGASKEEQSAIAMARTGVGAL
jgi:hypothetical protein